MKHPSKERLEQVVDRIEQANKYGGVGVTREEGMEMARALLAGMAQEPVVNSISPPEELRAMLFNKWGADDYSVQCVWNVCSAHVQPPAPVVPDAWIPCRERMPEGMTDVNISNGVDVGQAWWDGDVWQSQDDYYSVPGRVTHWQPLPAPPKKEV